MGVLDGPGDRRRGHHLHDLRKQLGVQQASLAHRKQRVPCPAASATTSDFSTSEDFALPAVGDHPPIRTREAGGKRRTRSPPTAGGAPQGSMLKGRGELADDGDRSLAPFLRARAGQSPRCPGMGLRAGRRCGARPRPHRPFPAALPRDVLVAGAEALVRRGHRADRHRHATGHRRAPVARQQLHPSYVLPRPARGGGRLARRGILPRGRRRARARGGARPCRRRLVDARRRGRRRTAAPFLARPELTHLLWIDADIGWPPDAVLRLLQYDLDLVCGLYRAKAAEVRFDVVPIADAVPRVAPARARGGLRRSG